MELSPAYGYLMQRAEVSGKNVFHSDVITVNATQFKIFQLIEEMQMERFGREARIPLLVNDLILHLNRMVYEEANPAKVKEQDLYQNLIYYCLLYTSSACAGTCILHLSPWTRWQGNRGILRGSLRTGAGGNLATVSDAGAVLSAVFTFI